MKPAPLLARIGVALLLSLPWASGRVRASADNPTPRCFAETDFCIRSPTILDFFEAHGQQYSLGYPISRELKLRGQVVQLFQRVAVHLKGDGGVETLGLLDDLLPLTRVDGSALPSADAALLRRAPRPDEPDFDRLAEAFLRSEVPDRLDDRPVAFLATFRAAAGADGAPPTAALSVFGWPTSRPAWDPRNRNLAYQRFQRAVFQYNAATGQSQALLLGDYVKSVLTGNGLTPDLVADTVASPLRWQYMPAAVDGLQRPWELPDSNLSDAFRSEAASAPILLWVDGFGPETRWPSHGQLDGGHFGALGLEYEVATEQAGTLERAASAAVSNLVPLGDFVVVVDARLQADGAAGYALQLRRQSDDERFSLVVDAGRRLATFTRRSNGRASVLWDWNPVAALREPTAFNRLTVRAVGPRFTAWANGALLFDLEAAGPDQGSLWLAALTWDQPAQARFANLRVIAPD